MDDLLLRGLPVERVHLWTDGAASQFKNRYTQMGNTADPLISSHNFAESYHGKGPHYGIGATLKNKIRRKVLAGQPVRNARDFYDALAGDEDLAVRVLFVGHQEALEKKPALDHLFSNLAAPKGIQASRAISTEELGAITLFRNTGDAVDTGNRVVLKLPVSPGSAEDPYDMDADTPMCQEEDGWDLIQIVEEQDDEGDLDLLSAFQL